MTTNHGSNHSFIVIHEDQLGFLAEEILYYVDIIADVMDDLRVYSPNVETYENCVKLLEETIHDIENLESTYIFPIKRGEISQLILVNTATLEGIIETMTVHLTRLNRLLDVVKYEPFSEEMYTFFYRHLEVTSYLMKKTYRDTTKIDPDLGERAYSFKYARTIICNAVFEENGIRHHFQKAI